MDGYAQESLFGQAGVAMEGGGQSRRAQGHGEERHLPADSRSGGEAVGARESRNDEGVAVVARHRISGKAGGGHLALGRLKAGQQNKTEAAYEATLKVRQAAGDVLWYRFEGLKLRLADNTFYTPDYAVMLASGQIECHEVKGFWQDDARAKIKIAAEQYPFRFLAVRVKPKKDGGGWDVEVFE